MAETLTEAQAYPQTNVHPGEPHDMRPQAWLSDRVERQHEERDVNLRAILLSAMTLGVAAIVIHVGVWYLMRGFAAHPAERIERAAATARGDQTPPEPRLQFSPPLDRAQVDAEERASLERYGWTDGTRSAARLPIEHAMDLLVRRGLPPVTRQGPFAARRGVVVRGGAMSPARALPPRAEEVRTLEQRSELPAGEAP